MFDVESALVALEIQVLSVGSEEIRGVCPMHYELTGKRGSLGDWYINIESGQHHCWSCDYRGNLMGLVRDLTGLDPWHARKWLADQGIAQITEEDLVPRHLRASNKTNPEEMEINEAHLAVFKPVPEEECEKRDLDPEVADEYEILWGAPPRLRGSDPLEPGWIVPIRTSTGGFMGYQYKSGSFVRNLPTGVEKRHTLFGLHLVEPDERALIVVESPLDVVRIATAGYGNAVATYGASVSPEQISLLADNCRTLILAMDNDIAGKQAHRTLRAHLESRLKILLFDYSGTVGSGINGWAKDPGDMNDKQIQRAVDRADTPLNRKLEGIF